MKKNESGDFCVLYLEPNDERSTLFQMIAGQKKPVVIMLTEHSRVFQRPDDFSALKHARRQMDLPIVFVIPNSSHFAQMAARSGFPVYLSIDALADALTIGNMARQRKTVPLAAGEQGVSPRKTVPLSPSGIHAPLPRKTVPLSPSGIHALVQQKSAANGSGVHAPALRKSAVNGSGIHAPLHPKTAYPTVMDDISFVRTAPLAGDMQHPMRPTVARVLTPPPLPAAPPPLVTPFVRPEPREGQGKRRRFPLLPVILTFALIIAGLGSFLVLAHALPGTAAGPTLVGHISFSSSEQLSETSSQGIEDQVTVDLNNIPAPAPHQSYYAWLLGDKNQSDPKAVLLGKLPVNNGVAHLFYPGDAQHTNLLLANSRFLVTEEDAAVRPIAPSPDQSAWRYYGEFSSTPINSPDNTNHYSYLDHLRHLLASDPTLDALELPGGLNNWLYRNTGKLLEWVSSTREQWEETKDAGFVRRQTIRALTYLDGISFVGLDLPANTNNLVNDRLARVGLLQVSGPTQDPPGYLSHIVHHLDGLLQAGGNTAALRKSEGDLITAMNNVDQWLSQVRKDAQKIVKMSDQELQQPGTLTLLNDMIDNANNAYTGQLDPATGQTREGVIWIHDHMQELATLGISTFSVQNAPAQMIPDTKHVKASQATVRRATVLTKYTRQ